MRPAEIHETRPSKSNASKSSKPKGKKGIGKMNNIQHNFELLKDSKFSMMNSNRVIEPFSPTFEHPEDFVPSNQTSFRPLIISKYTKKLENSNKQEPSEAKIVEGSIFNETEKLNLNDSKFMNSSNDKSYNKTDKIDLKKIKKIKDNDNFKETGKFVNPLSDTSEATSKQRAVTKRASEKDTARKSRRRHKSCNGRNSRGKPKHKTKSEKSKEMSLWYEYNKLSKQNEDEVFSAEECK